MTPHSPKYPLQLEFFEKLKRQAAPNISLVNEVADVLELSTDGAYRRIRGESSLSMDEYIVLSNHFNIAQHAATTEKKGVAQISYSPLATHESLETYLASVYSDLTAITANENHGLIFTAEHIPIFHYFRFPHLRDFKLFYWSKSVLNAPTLKNKKFDPALIPANAIDLSEKIFDIYTRVNSTEIWTEDTITGMLRQLEFFWETGNFETAAQAMAVCRDLEQMLKMIEQYAETGRKNNPFHAAPASSRFNLYYSEVMIGNDCIKVHSGDMERVYLIYNTFNAIITSDKDFCAEIDLWINNLVKKSISLSGMGEKQRRLFFDRMYARIHAFMAHIGAA